MGRPVSRDSAYAKEIGIDGKRGARTIRNLGGSQKLQSLSPEVRAILLKPHRDGTSRGIIKGGLAARGFFRATDKRVQVD